MIHQNVILLLKNLASVNANSAKDRQFIQELKDKVFTTPEKLKLSDSQWFTVIDLVRKYRRQIPNTYHHLWVDCILGLVKRKADD